jgi:hypothetical protein
VKRRETRRDKTRRGEDTKGDERRRGEEVVRIEQGTKRWKGFRTEAVDVDVP